MRVEALKRKFKYGSMTLDDPGEHMSPDEAREFYATSGMMGELRTAVVEGPAIEGQFAVFTFVRATRDKG